MNVLPLALVLEEGRFDGPVARAFAAAWARIAERSIVRRVDLPAGVRAVAIGGATLGGSGKTPLAIACAAEIAASGVRVALIGHAYGARPGRARVVAGGDCHGEVGDEALVAARALASTGARVVVAPTRAEAVAFATREADVVVLDGVAQTTPARAALALLAVDAVAPWGRAGAVAPRGDLRAPRDALLRACDGVVTIGDDRGGDGVATDEAVSLVADGDRQNREHAAVRWHASAASSGARVGGELVPWGDLAGARLGLLCAMARPERVVRALALRGIALQCVLRAPDHGPPSAKLLARADRARNELGIELWLATAKCAVHFATCGAPQDTRQDTRRHPTQDLPHIHRDGRDGAGNTLPGRPGTPALGAPTGVIEYALALPHLLRERLRQIVVP